MKIAEYKQMMAYLTRPGFSGGGNVLPKKKPKEEAEVYAEEEDEYTNTFFIPERSRWKNLKNLKHDIGEDLNKATEAIEEQNPELERVLVSIDFNIKNKLDDGKSEDTVKVIIKYSS